MSKNKDVKNIGINNYKVDSNGDDICDLGLEALDYVLKIFLGAAFCFAFSSEVVRSIQKTGVLRVSFYALVGIVSGLSVLSNGYAFAKVIGEEHSLRKSKKKLIKQNPISLNRSRCYSFYNETLKKR